MRVYVCYNNVAKGLAAELAAWYFMVGRKTLPCFSHVVLMLHVCGLNLCAKCDYARGDRSRQRALITHLLSVFPELSGRRANGRWMLLAGMQGPPALCSGHAVQKKKKRIAALARFYRAIALICTELHDRIPPSKCSKHRINRVVKVLVGRRNGLSVVKLRYRTERSMIFPRCWPRPCALINPASQISDVHYRHAGSAG